MKKYTFIMKLLLALCIITPSKPSDLAVIKYPIVDLTDGLPVSKILPISIGNNTSSCNRTRQGLFNELAHCLESDNNFVKIYFDNIKSLTTSDTPSCFWAPIESLIPLQNLENTKLAQAIPHQSYGHEPTITLLRPWKYFSVGTRFKHAPERDTKKSYGIIRADFKKDKLIFDSIPRKIALQEINKDTQSARKLFVAIINDLVSDIEQNYPGQVIPYVWGGCSFSKLYKKNGFYEKNGAWERNGANNPYTGYDCSSFIMKMAQIAGLDFPWQISASMDFSMKKLTQHDQLQDGDIIWISGHVMIVSNIEKNEIIEARGYGDGYGCLHRIKLHELLKDITTYNELLDYYYAKKQITFKKKIGAYEEGDSFDLLKLC